MNYIVYVIKNKNGKLYIGQTNNLKRQLFEHNSGLSRYTSSFKGLWNLVYQESWPTRGQAIKREKELKTGRGRDFLKRVLKTAR